MNQCHVQARCDQNRERRFLQRAQCLAADDVFLGCAPHLSSIAFQQGGGPIRIYRRARPSDAPHPIHDPEDEYKAHHHEGGDVPPPSAVRLAEEPAAADEDDADARDDEDDE